MTTPAYDVLTVPVDGGELTCGRWTGGPGAPTVLAAHGITGNHRSWGAVARALDGAVTLVAPDLRGRGRSNVLGAPFGMAAHVADLRALADRLELERTVLVGHSMGGFVATSAANAYPDRFGPLVLVDGGVALRVPPAADLDAMLEAFLGPAMARLAMTFPSRTAYSEFFRAHPAIGPHWSEDVEAYVQYDLEGAEPELRSSCVRAAVRTDGADILLDETVIDAVRTPGLAATLLWATRGLLDEPEGVYDQQRLAEIDLDPELVRTEAVPGANHYSIVLATPYAAAVAEHVRVAASVG
ncbi:MAG: alpha/beta hydrolase [Actinomycetota bacterium]|nr:alpha/beta hydrolase [Actinomycetota bacterium]